MFRGEALVVGVVVAFSDARFRLCNHADILHDRHRLSSPAHPQRCEIFVVVAVAISYA